MSRRGAFEISGSRQDVPVRAFVVPVLSGVDGYGRYDIAGNFGWLSAAVDPNAAASATNTI